MSIDSDSGERHYLSIRHPGGHFLALVLRVTPLRHMRFANPAPNLVQPVEFARRIDEQRRFLDGGAAGGDALGKAINWCIGLMGTCTNWLVALTCSTEILTGSPTHSRRIVPVYRAGTPPTNNTGEFQLLPAGDGGGMGMV
jgi:hypothetical protein